MPPNRAVFAAVALGAWAFGAEAAARTPTPNGGELEQVGVVEGARDLPFDSLGLVALITYTGFKDWRWGSASFRFDSEGWFSTRTGSGGLDKLGHAYGAYMTAELLYWRLSMVHGGRSVSSLYPALFSTLLYQYIELFDGFSVDHGYAYEDVIMNEVGVLFSFLRHASPRFAQLFDYRLFYYPSGGSSFRPMIDYEGQKFVAAVRLVGIPGVERTPFRYFELLGGYYTRGFPRYARSELKSQHVFVGVGLNLSELVFRPLADERGEPFRFIDLASRYFQSPLYVATERSRSAAR